MKEIPNFEGYWASKEGFIYKLKNGEFKFCKSHKSSKGYMQINLYGTWGRVIKRVHRLVAQTYLIDYSESLQVNHLNMVKDDNRVSNLSMCTNQENKIHGLKNHIPEKFKLFLYFLLSAYKNAP